MDPQPIDRDYLKYGIGPVDWLICQNLTNEIGLFCYSGFLLSASIPCFCILQIVTICQQRALSLYQPSLLTSDDLNVVLIILFSSQIKGYTFRIYYHNKTLFSIINIYILSL
jgi:hypothetical protein